MSRTGKHVFISYVSDDASSAEQLCELLDAARIPYWRDRTHLAPGTEWKLAIRDAINTDSLVFLACFSSRSQARHASYMNEEISMAVDQFRLRPPGVPWLIPVRLDDCVIPDWDLGAGRRLAEIQCVDLFGPDHAMRVAALIARLTRLVSATSTNDPEPPSQTPSTIPTRSPTPLPAARPVQRAGRGAVQAGRDITGAVATGQGARATSGGPDRHDDSGGAPQ